MAAPIPATASFVVSGNMIIQFLAASLLLVTGALVAVIVYVFRGLAKEVERLGNRIDGLGASLGNRIDGLGASLGNRIDGLGASLGNRIDKLTERMDKLTERIDNVADTLHAEIASVRQDVYHRLEQTREPAS
jgi:predicted PurR-regulated permease PerM